MRPARVVCQQDDIKTVFGPLVTSKEVKKTRSPLNGYVAVFSNVGGQSSAHDQFYVVSTMVITATHPSCVSNTCFGASLYRVPQGGPLNRSWTFPFPRPHQRCGSAKSCASEGGAPPIKPASGQDLMCCDIQQHVRKINPRFQQFRRRGVHILRFC